MEKILIRYDNLHPSRETEFHEMLISSISEVKMVSWIIINGWMLSSYSYVIHWKQDFHDIVDLFSTLNCCFARFRALKLWTLIFNLLYLLRDNLIDIDQGKIEKEVQKDSHSTPMLNFASSVIKCRFLTNKI